MRGPLPLCFASGILMPVASARRAHGKHLPHGAESRIPPPAAVLVWRHRNPTPACQRSGEPLGAARGAHGGTGPNRMKRARAHDS